jgi:hypothetical protein
MDAVTLENKRRIKDLTAQLRRGRQEERGMVRLCETFEASLDALLLARSRCEILEKQLDHAERRADWAKIFALAPQIQSAVAERNKLQAEYLKLASRLADKFGIEIHPQIQDQQKSAQRGS